MNANELLDRELGALEQGTEFTTRGRTITEGDLMSFSALTGDWHPQHSDAEWAKRSRFSGRVAHGMLVLSYAVGLMPFDPERVVALRGLESAKFKRPVGIGDTIRVRCRVESTRPLDDETELVQLAFRVLNQDDRAVALARIDAVCRRAPEPSMDEAGPRADTAPRPEEPHAAPANGAGYWPEETLRLYGGETFL
jgi:3-hydroxybutyryl-CoA dehydratase